MIYLDNAATTKCSFSNIQLMQKYLGELFFNPSSNYSSSYQIIKELERARLFLLNKMNGKGRIVFTSSGTESDVMAILGSKKKPKSKIVISSVEHNAIYKTSQSLKEKGYEVILAPCHSNGTLNLELFEKILDDNVSLVSIMHVNNETGGINNLEQISHILHKKTSNAIFHSDGIQAFGKIQINLNKMGVDLYSFSGHKIGASKGVGGLYIKEGVVINPLLLGGGQEYGLRSSTENVPGIMSLEKAFIDKVNNMSINYQTSTSLFKKLMDFFFEKNHFYLLSDYSCSPYIFSFSNNLIKGEVLQRLLETKSIYVGTGSACSSKSSIRRVPIALSIPNEYLEGIIRISFSPENKMEEIDFLINAVTTIFKEYANYDII